LRGDALGDLVGVVRGGQPGADVEELTDPRLSHQVPDGAEEEQPRLAGNLLDTGERFGDLLGDDSVDLVVVLEVSVQTGETGWRVDRSQRLATLRIPAAH
jgi:hypothetical protein